MWLFCLGILVDVCGPDRKWVAYSKLYQSLEVDSSVLFQQLTSIEYHWHQQELPYQQVGLWRCGSRPCHTPHLSLPLVITSLSDVSVQLTGGKPTSLPLGEDRLNEPQFTTESDLSSPDWFDHQEIELVKQVYSQMGV